MSTREAVGTTLACMLAVATTAHAEGPALGTPLGPEEVPFYARYVMPDGNGLPDGSGSVAEGASVYAERCASCHGETGREGPIMPPVGPNDVWEKPAGLHWPYATTLFDYIRRAMPFEAPKSLSNDETYALTAFILAKNGVIAEDQVLDADSLADVAMPNRGRFIDVWAAQGEKPW